MPSDTVTIKIPHDPFLIARLLKLAQEKGLEVSQLVEKIFRKRCK